MDSTTKVLLSLMTFGTILTDRRQVAIHEFLHGLGFLSSWAQYNSLNITFPSFLTTDLNGFVTGIGPQWIFDKLLSDSKNGIWLSSYAKAMNSSVTQAVKIGGPSNWSDIFQNSSGFRSNPKFLT